MEVKPPKDITLKKYGLTKEEWLDLFHAQGSVCAVCKNKTKSGKYNTDHEHVTKWKEMPDEKRKLYVRGILCWFCNKMFMSRGITITKLKNAVHYLAAYEERKPK